MIFNCLMEDFEDFEDLDFVVLLWLFFFLFMFELGERLLGLLLGWAEADLVS